MKADGISTYEAVSLFALGTIVGGYLVWLSLHPATPKASGGGRQAKFHDEFFGMKCQDSSCPLHGNKAS